MNAFFNLSEMNFLGKDELLFDFPQEPQFIFDSDISSSLKTRDEEMEYQRKIEDFQLEGSVKQFFEYEETAEPSYNQTHIPLFEPKKSFPWNPAETGHYLIPSEKAKDKKPSYYKNFGRNMINIIISNLRTFRNQLSKFASHEKLELNDLLDYLDSTKHNFTSVKAIQDSWIPSEGDSDEETKCKTVFRKFCAWFLRKKMARYIIKDGKMHDRLEYLKYKTRVMSKGVKRPEAYTSNFFELMK